MSKPKLQVIDSNPGTPIVDAILHQGYSVPMVFTGTNQLNDKKTPGIKLYFTEQGYVLIRSVTREVIMPLTNFIFVELAKED